VVDAGGIAEFLPQRRGHAVHDRLGWRSGGVVIEIDSVHVFRS
jgi:hypothetical protein